MIHVCEHKNDLEHPKLLHKFKPEIFPSGDQSCFHDHWDTQSCENALCGKTAPSISADSFLLIAMLVPVETRTRSPREKSVPMA